VENYAQFGCRDHEEKIAVDDTASVMESPMA